MATKLKVISEYRNRETHYGVGSVIEVTDEQVKFLMADAPGCFEVYTEPEVKAVEAPPVDKMVRTSTRKRTSKAK